MTYKELRKKYPVFRYEGYSWKIKGSDFVASFSFTSGKLSFHPQVKIKNIPLKRAGKLDREAVENLVFNLGMIELLSYWKCVCSPKIEVAAGRLSDSQIDWWKDLVLNGMGQYFYENKIDFRGVKFLTIVSTGENKLNKAEGIKGEGVLLPVGGGKDSAVTLEIFKKFKKDVSCFALNPTKADKDLFKVSGFKELIVAERGIEEDLLKLNRAGYLNGHTPFLAYVSFLCLLVSYLFNKRYVVLSNEDSSNEGNVQYLGKEINHQYSKSLDFENKFRKYCRQNLSEEFDYFSVLRPWHEIQIARIFSTLPKYFPVFLSCNEAYKTYSGTRKATGRWCCHCSKCLFVFMALYPFLGAQKLLSIFGENLFEKDTLLPIMLELIGEREVKPFECVGTRKESLVALYLSLQKAREEGRIPLLLQYFEIEIIPKHKNWDKMVKEVMNHWNDRNNIPWEE